MRRLPAVALAATLLWAAPTMAWAAPQGSGPVVDDLRSTGVVVRLQPGAPTLPPNVDASAWLVADLDTGDVLAAKDAHGRYLPASTLKTLTALTVAPLLDPAKAIQVASQDVEVDGTRVGLVPGKSYSVKSLLTGMLIASGNDAADALARAATGTRAGTVAAMNTRAKALGATDTVAGTPSGLDAPGERTSAYDLALFGRAVLADPTLAAYLMIPAATVTAPGVRPFAISNHNPLLGRYAGAIGVKAGYTTAARATYIGAAQRGGRRIIVTLLHAYPHFTPFAESLLDWGFLADGHVTPVGHLEPRPGADVTELHSADLPHQKARLATATRPIRAGHHGPLDVIAATVLVVGATVVALRLRVLRRHRMRRRLAGPGGS